MHSAFFLPLTLLGGDALAAHADLSAAPQAALISHGGWNYPRASSAPANAPTSTNPAPIAPPATAIDPYAPRRDAPVFRLRASQSAKPDAAPELSPATPHGTRYYSVHRQVGRQPDATPLPEPVYLDALPVQLSSPVSSEDLAAPPSAPQIIRDANGRVRAVADLEDPA